VSAAPAEAPSALRIVIPFTIVTLIWGATWIVIIDQLGSVPPSWSITYRFIAAAGFMFVYALATRTPMRLGLQGQIFALLFGVSQFVLNFNFVYRAELYITSGLVAVTFAALLVSNAVLGWIFLNQRMTGRFILGSAIAMGGIGLLFYNELRVMPAGLAAVLAGLAFTFLGIFSASIANIMQATDRARALPMPSLLAWGMFYGVIVNAAWAWASAGPPAFEWRLGYVAGIVYLGGFASAIAFTLYFNLIRVIGPARAAYSSVLVPVIAMIMSTLFEDYRWSWYAAAGGVFVLIGLVVALRGRERPPVPQPFGREG